MTDQNPVGGAPSRGDNTRPQGETVQLRRALSLPLITFYGLGTILGAGIYVLVGKVAGLAGLYAPVSFLVAGVIAALTAFSYAELSSRFPRAGAEAVYVKEGLRLRWLSTLVGLLIAFSGLVSSATIANGFVGYLRVFFDVPDAPVIVAVVLTLGLLAAWGIMESVTAAAVATVIEIAGLILVVAVSWQSFGELPGRLSEMVPPLEAHAWRGIVLGAFLAFYAFIGFEDMVNVAEEVKSPEKNMPRAIILAMATSTLLYLLVVTVAVLALPIAALSHSQAPLALMFEHATGMQPTVIALISLFAVVNGALIQMIMASRMLYGLSREGRLPRRLSRVSTRTRTPLLATALITAGVLGFALWLPLMTLARSASFIVLLVFALVNLSLIFIKRRQAAGPGVRAYPAWIPYCGFVLALLLLGFQTLDVLGRLT